MRTTARCGPLTPVTRLLVLCVLLLPRLARPEPVLHEYVPPPSAASDPAAAAIAAGRVPPYIRVEDRVLPRPDTAAASGPGERAPGAALDRDSQVSPDRTTTMDGVLHYREVFNPSVVPFKRMSAFDRVKPGYLLGLREPALRLVPLSPGPTPPDRDAFWGSLLLSVKPGKPVPIPSVAAEVRILSYTSTPQVAVSFHRDSADNYWVRTNHRGALRLVFLCDAPRHYFAPQIPATVTALDVPAAERPTLPPAVRAAADKVIARIEVRRSDTLYRQLERLIAYFRSFEAGVLPRLTGDTYLDIALSQRGVCRHRSLAFVITAQALGIPARYVHNEAHAFTEVFIPRLGWVRVDLGGASLELRVENAQDKALHDPGPDPFPRPSRYTGGYSQLARGTRITGVQPERQRLTRRGGRVSLRVYDRSRGPAPSAPTAPPLPSPSAPGEAADGEAADAARAAAHAPPPRTPTQIALFSGTRAAYRGEQVEVWGRISQSSQAAAGLRVEVYLSKDGKVAEATLGATVTGSDGRFRATFAVPRNVEVGDYQIFAATPGDAKREASLSD